MAIFTINNFFHMIVMIITHQHYVPCLLTGAAPWGQNNVLVFSAGTVSQQDHDHNHQVIRCTVSAVQDSYRVNLQNIDILLKYNSLWNMFLYQENASQFYFK